MNLVAPSIPVSESASISDMFKQLSGNGASNSEPSNPTPTQSSMRSENSRGIKNRRTDDDDENDDESECELVGESDVPSLWDLLNNWQPLGKGTFGHKHNRWIYTLGVAVRHVQSENKKLKECNKKLNDDIIKLADRLTRLESNLAATPPQVPDTQPIQPSYAKVAAGEANSEAELVLINKVMIDMKRKEDIQRNIIVIGLREGDLSGEKGKEEEEKGVTELMRQLDIDPSVIKRKKNVLPNPVRPSPLLIQFENSQHVEIAIERAKQLKKTNKLRDVYINRDMTESERSFEAALRKKRNDENDKLPNTDDLGRKYGIDDATNNRYYWRIDRSGRLVKAYFQR